MARFHPGAGREHHYVITPIVVHDLAHAVQVHDGRTVDAGEVTRVELRFEHVHPLAVQVRPAADVQPRVVRLAELGRIGVDTRQVTLLRGPEGAARIDATGARSGIGARLRQAVSFTLADQMPDFVLYEAAVLAGRSVLAVPVDSDAVKQTIVRLLRERGAHFINFYGRFATEELEAWRGPELAIPGLLRR